MPDENAAPEQPEPTQPDIRAYTAPPGGTIEAYSNYINVNWGVFDVRIRFGQLIPISGEAETAGFPQRVVLEKVAVTLAWREAKVLRDLLNDCVERYEKVNGEMKVIKLP